ncbi:MAG: TetR-like C-terminal domain-containing protein [Polyangiaceae bacterium]
MLRVLEALRSGQLKASALTARGVSQVLGKTTGALYHHHGSLDGFLHRVAQAGFAELGASLGRTLEHQGSVEDVAAAFVAFGLDNPELHFLMFEKRYDWSSLRETGALPQTMPGLTLWNALVATLQARGVAEPELTARLLYAGLHGLVSLGISGRANVARIDIPDRAMALDLARRLARRLLQANAVT